MASRKQKRPSITRQPRTAKVTEKTLGESIIEQMAAFNQTLLAIHAEMKARNGMLSVVTSEQKKQTDAMTAMVNGPPVEVTPPAEGSQTQALPAEPLKRKRGRPSKAELAAREAARGEEIQKTVDFVEQTGKFPQMCPCGVREDLPPHLHGKGCPVHAPKEAPPAHRVPDRTGGDALAQDVALAHADRVINPPVPAPTYDDVRAVAITFIGKHGKEKLGDLIKSFGAPNLTALPVEKLPDLLAKLQAGV